MPPPAVASTDSDKPHADDAYGVYTVQSGDNLYNLARDFFTTEKEIQELNEMGTKTTIVPGQELIVPTAALRDEGTSYHYQRAGRFSRPHPAAVRAIREACRRRGRKVLLGRTWTTDGVYRETPAAIRRRKKEGCIAVEMEAAAFFAVARFRKVVFGQVLYAGDDVSGPEWDSRGWIKRFEVREELFCLAVDACRRLPA